MPLPEKTVIIPRQTVRKDHSVLRASNPNAGVGLRVFAHVHTYPPYALTGGAFTMHHLLLAGRGTRRWNPRVVTDHAPPRSDVFDGIPVRYDNNVRTVTTDYMMCQVALTHLDATPKATELAARNGRPLVHLVHNARTLHYYRVTRRQCALVIFNSEALRDEVNWDGPSVVLNPITDYHSYYTAETGDAVVLVNLAAEKGAHLFFELAMRNPGVRFIGVKGTFGRQEPAPPLPNLEIWEPQTDIREVYRQARLVVMPSSRETWGRIATEAAISGIPSICSPTPGLLEANVASAFIDPHDFERWNKAVRRLIRGQHVWAAASEAASERAYHLMESSATQVAEVCGQIEALI